MIRCLAVLLFLTSAAMGQVQPIEGAELPEARLKAGDAAPPLHIAKWIKGDEIKQFEDGRIYVIEFWATWCGPCIRGIPRLTQFQRKYPEVEVISIAIWQREKTQKERNTAVAGFVESRVELARVKQDPDLAMEYAVAVDQDRETANAWMDGAGRIGIPSAFIIGRAGQVEWYGHPYSKDEMTKALDAYVSGQWDREAFNMEYRKENAFVIARASTKAAIREAQAGGSMALALSTLDRAITAFPTVTSFRMDKFQLLLTVPGHTKEAYEYGSQLAQDEWNTSSVLNAMSWMIVSEPELKDRDFDLALRCASRADTLENHQDSNILDTLARVHWDMGQKEEAIKIQERAVMKAPEKSKASLQETLDKYRGNKTGS